jgi:hypothetical protein
MTSRFGKLRGETRFKFGEVPTALRSETLTDENHRLRELVVTLSAIVVKQATDGFDEKRARAGYSAGGPDLVQLAEQCFSLAKTHGLEPDFATRLETIGNSLMTKAVEIESILQREKWKRETVLSPHPA